MLVDPDRTWRAFAYEEGRAGLLNAVKGPLGLSPDRNDFDPLIAADVWTTLGGLATVIQGVGALRTHAGDAQGCERGYARVDARIGRLAIHAAGTVALFLIETWQRKLPTRTCIGMMTLCDRCT